jgi:hypothetical protein
MRTEQTIHRSIYRLAVVSGLAIAAFCLPLSEASAQKQRGAPRTGAPQKNDQRKEKENDRIMTPPQGLEEPTDLAIRTLRDTANSGAERKQPVMRPAALTSSQVGRLRVADERIDNVIPFRGYPLSERLPLDKRSIYADASFGFYSTARLAAGYSGESWPFDYSLSGHYLTTEGDPDNSARRELAATLAGGYIIGDSYGIFSGGHMGGRAHYGSGAYRLFAIEQAPQREVSRTEISMSGRNTWRGISYNGRAGYRSIEMVDSTTSATERSIEGALDLSRKLDEITIGGTADGRLTVSRDTSISYGELGAYARYTLPAMTLQGGGALVIAGESGGETVVRLAPRVDARLYLAGAITVTAGLHGGVTQNTLAGLLKTNPYISSDYSIRHDIATIGYSAGLRIEPSRSLALTANLRNTEYARYAYFAEQTGGTFAPMYDRATIGTIDATFFWRIGENDELAALATYTRGTIGSASRPVPYLPALVSEASYRKRLASMPLTLTTHIRFIGARDGGTGTTKNGVMLAGIEGRYQLTPQFDVALEFQNILGTQYELWDGYRERGLFAALGIKSRF